MKTFLDIEHWPRKEHFHFFRKFDEPFFGVTVDIDSTLAYQNAKALGISFFVYYLHKTLVAANAIEPFRYRVSNESVVLWERIDVSATISRDDGSFGFSLIEFEQNIHSFSSLALKEIARVKKAPGLLTRKFDDDNLIHFSAIPWIDFSSLSHARNYSVADSCPKVSFGKMSVSSDGRRRIPMSIHVHHALMDGSHLGQFIERLQSEMNSPL